MSTPRWVFVSDDEHLCTGPWHTEEEGVAWIRDHPDTVDNGGRLVYINPANTGGTP